MIGDGQYFVRKASATTPRSTLELLSLSYPFTQVSLLTADEFAREGGRRRSRSASSFPPIDTQVLEEFHRLGALVPFFRVDLTGGDQGRVIDLSKSETAKRSTSSVLSELLYAASEGRASDPMADTFEPWPQERERIGWPSVRTGYLYSRHQLLGFDAASSILAELTHVQTGKTSIEWHVEGSKAPNQDTIDALSSWRSLAVVLCALDTYFWPQVIRSLRNDYETWRKVRAELDIASMLKWLSLSSEQLATQSTELNMAATFRDDLGEFYDIVRRANSKAWDSLRGDALAAMDYRIAADVLKRCVEERSPSIAVTSHPLEPLSHQGLSERPHSLDAALTSLTISPFPSLVISLEGETEWRVVPRVMELLGISPDRNFIEFVDFEGTKDLALIARYAAQPVIGREHGDWVILDRPVTRFLVLTDAENKFATPALREQQRKNLLKSLVHGFPPECRKDLLSYRRRERTVEIKTWGKYPFEFAHFTNRQLAQVLSALAKAPHPGGDAGLLSQLQRERVSASPNIADVNWSGRGKLNKPDLADMMWPMLEKRIKRSLAQGWQGPPVMKAVLRAYQMATTTPRATTVLRRH